MERPEEIWQREVWALSGRALWWRTLVVFLVALAFFTFLYAPSPLIYDSDSYYHLGIARGYAEEGIFDQLKWVRFGLLAEQFGDKEFLFHAALIPFAAWMEPALGGRLALTLLGALALATIGFLSLRAIGRWGMVVPFLLVFGSLELTWRLVRLRPEIASLIILLCALWCAVQRRYGLLGLLSLVYALTYTAIHAYVGIFFLVFFGHAWALRRWEWRLLAYPILGAGIGLLIHPQFPNDLVVWWYQSVEYFRFKGVLDVGNEIQPMRTDIALMVNLGWLLGMGILWRASEKTSPPRPGDASVTFGIAAVAFGLLYLMMSRFALYAMALTTLWMLFEMRRQGREITRWVRLPWRGRVPLGVAWLLCFLISLPVASYELGRYRHRNSPGPNNSRIVDREQFSAALPDGARVANPWRSTPIYMFWAPQGRYIQVLDPVFLAATNSSVFLAQKSIFAGEEPDTPVVAAGLLESEYIAFSAATGNPRLTQRLLADPRVKVLHRGINLLVHLQAPRPSPFVIDWKLIAPGTEIPVTGASDIALWTDYPLVEQAEIRELEGYVDARRVVGPEQCLGLVHQVEVTEPRVSLLEFAPAGPSEIWLDDKRLVEVLDSPGAVLGQGVLLPVPLDSGVHRISVSTCPDARTRRSGFYLVEREDG